MQSVLLAKSVNIIGDGVYAGVTMPSGDGITINSATANVALRNLTINGLGSGTNGIIVTSVGICTSKGASSAGLLLMASTSI